MPSNRGGRGGGPGNRRLHYAATGSNGTPLGSPAREFGKSPKTNADEPAEQNHSEAAHSKTPPTGSEKEVKKGKKRKGMDDGVCVIILSLTVVSTIIYYRNPLIKRPKWKNLMTS